MAWGGGLWAWCGVGLGAATISPSSCGLAELEAEGKTREDGESRQAGEEGTEPRDMVSAGGEPQILPQTLSPCPAHAGQPCLSHRRGRGAAGSLPSLLQCQYEGTKHGASVPATPDVIPELPLNEQLQSGGHPLLLPRALPQCHGGAGSAKALGTRPVPQG